MQKRILIISTNRLRRNGMSTVIMNYYRFMKHDGLKFDFAINNHIDADYRDEILARGDQVYLFKSRKSVPMMYIFRLRRLIKKNKYDVVHIHGNSGTILLEQLAARRMNAKVIVHAHGVQTNHPLIHKLTHKFLISNCDVALAASQSAGEFMFGQDKQFQVIPNGIRFDRFSFNLEDRKLFRNKLDLNENTKMILCVGAFTKEKNQAFLIRLFHRLVRIDANYRLVFIGQGDLMNDCKKLTMDLGIERLVFFLGKRDSVSEWYSAADIFALPSLHESFGIVALEAQANGLPCVLSDKLPYEVKLDNQVKFASVDCPSSQETWVQDILKSGRVTVTKNDFYCWGRRGYDIVRIASKVRDIYIS
ncbi:glycosyltransferase [Levilactobacillus tujiorum]|uniref:glycosyltransferase n=1 Tax=Levilactobacillus tujiorum TaxID=2912243 RepID=UPI00145633CE|nr:glycosyltransferase [Levilactobacillus tujiorum]NLR31734.1 glycosyltransferase family 1 protein [Levilactobacillus tujiorum]